MQEKWQFNLQIYNLDLQYKQTVFVCDKTGRLQSSSLQGYGSKQALEGRHIAADHPLQSGCYTGRHKYSAPLNMSHVI